MALFGCAADGATEYENLSNLSTEQCGFGATVSLNLTSADRARPAPRTTGF